MTRRSVFEGKLLELVVDDGWEIVLHPDAVAVVAVDRDGVLTLVRQVREAVGGPVLELPAGLLEAGETPLECARRELREETGLHGGEWVQVASAYTTPGFCDERMHLFVALGLEHGDASPESSEELELVRVPVGELPALLDELEDMKTIAGLALYLRLASG
jgi:ADP-ribose pyrophosphatase